MLLPLILLLASAQPSPPAPAPTQLDPDDITLAAAELAATRAFGRQDVDHDGFLTLGEYWPNSQPKLAPGPRVGADRLEFTARDRDHDGLISAEEYKHYEVAQFRGYDIDRNGVATSAEIAIALKGPSCLGVGLDPVFTAEQKVACARQAK